MFRSSRFAFAILVAALILAACETVPKVTTMSEAGFRERMVIAKSTKPPSSAIEHFTKLIDSGELTQDMRIQALFERGSLRRGSGLNPGGALTDFDEVLALNPAHPLAPNARIERDYVANDLAAIHARRASGRLQTLAAWFDDAWLMGERDVAAKRYQTSGLSPTKRQVSLLISDSYICTSGGEGDAVYKFGNPRSDLDGLRWCRAL